MAAEAAALEQLTQSEAARTELTDHLERTGADAERAAQHARDEITGLQQQLAQASTDARQEREAARNAEARAARGKKRPPKPCNASSTNTSQPHRPRPPPSSEIGPDRQVDA
ncbi:hypothetical protein ACFPRL_34905 [Pseudoclavibacter helvolus]